MKTILIYRKDGDKRVQVSDRLYNLLCTYKIWWPPETVLHIGRKKLTVDEFTPWPPPEQAVLLSVKQSTKRKEKYLG